MKIIAFLISIGFCLSFVPIVFSIKCIVCDREPNGIDCRQTNINCSADRELGQSFDSCFTYQILVTGDNFNLTYVEKNCSISHGCKHLKEMMCHRDNRSLDGAVRKCDILCCDSDYCNVGEPNFTAKPDVSAHTRATTQHNVLGYRSTAARYSGEKWKLVFGIFYPVIYFLVSGTLF